MKIWYQGLIPISATTSAYYSSMEVHAAALLPPDTAVSFHGLPEALFPSGYGPAELTRSMAGEFVEVAALARSVIEAEQLGFDVVAIGTLQEPGLQLFRTLTDIPVVGYGQAAALFGRSVGDQLGVLAFNPDLFPLFRDRINVHIPDIVGPVEPLDVTYGQIHASFTDPDVARRLRVQIEMGCRRLVEAGATAIVPGQMLLAEAAWRLEIGRVDEVPVLDALGALLLLSEDLVTLRKRSRLEVTRRGFRWSRAEEAVRQAIHALRQAGA